jgi:hypothetical protein
LFEVVMTVPLHGDQLGDIALERLEAADGL